MIYTQSSIIQKRYSKFNPLKLFDRYLRQQRVFFKKIMKHCVVYDPIRGIIKS